VKERGTVERLNELDMLIEDAKARKARGEPTMQSYVSLLLTFQPTPPNYNTQAVESLADV
jgi:Nnf1